MSLDKIFKYFEKYKIKILLRDLEESIQETEEIITKSDINIVKNLGSKITEEISYVEYVALQISRYCDGKDEYKDFTKKAMLLHSKSHEYKEMVNNIK